MFLALLVDVGQGEVVDKHHSGQVKGHSHSVHQSLRFLDALDVAMPTEGLDQSGDRQLGRDLVCLEHGPQGFHGV